MAIEPTSGRIASGTQVFPLRVYYEDTDAGGVVYHASYLRYAERARGEMLRAVGIGQRALAESDGIVFAVRRCEIDYLRPARLDDALEIVTGNLALEAASLWADQVVRRGAEDLVRMRLRLACVGAGGRPARLPPCLRTALAPLVKSNATPEKVRN
jgi:acyl-CoA thioester hydrolase